MINSLLLKSHCHDMIESLPKTRSCTAKPLPIEATSRPSQTPLIRERWPSWMLVADPPQGFVYCIDLENGFWRVRAASFFLHQTFFGQSGRSHRWKTFAGGSWMAGVPSSPVWLLCSLVWSISFHLCPWISMILLGSLKKNGDCSVRKLLNMIDGS